jgi:hypothetical protein
MIKLFTSLIPLSIVALISTNSFAYTDFSNEKTRKSIVLVQVKKLLTEDYVNAIAVAPNLLLATESSVSGFSIKLSVDDKAASVVQIFREEGLALLSYPTGDLTPALISKGVGKSKRAVYLVPHAGDAVAGRILDFAAGPRGHIGMSMSKTILPLTGSGVFNNCGELIGIYDESTTSKTASAASLVLINKVINGISGTTYSKTDCPSEGKKQAADKDKREQERREVEAETSEKLRKAEAEAKKKQEVANEKLRTAQAKVLEEKEIAQKALAEAEKKSKENLEAAEKALADAKREAEEKEALAEEEKSAAETEKLAAEAALKKSNEAAEAALKKSKEAAETAIRKQKDEQRKLLIIGGILLGLLLLVVMILIFRRSKRNNTQVSDEGLEPEIAPLLSFDVFVRGDSVGIKVPAEFIARERGVVIGRSAADSDFVIDSPEISRAHIRLSEKDGILYIEDLGSANGTNLNGIKLQPAQVVALHHGDTLELAATIFSVEFKDR